MGQNVSGSGKKKWVLPLIIVLIVAVVIGVVVVILRLSGGAMSGDDMYGMDGDFYYDDSYMDVGANNYYSGLIEAQETQEVQRDASKEIDEIFVEVGDEVKKGDPLFSYKTDEMQLEIEKAKLSLENDATSISEYNNQIASLQNLINDTSDNSLKAEYQLQITNIQNEIRQTQLQQRTTQAEIDATQKSIENAVVKSTVDGVVKTISTSSMDNEPYMTILGTGTYRVKGSVDEMNVGMLSEGMSVIVHSRVDQNATWSGTITKIDTENINKDVNYDIYGMGGNGDSSTKYTFYVELDRIDGLLLGQHVYIEPIFDYGDYGEMEEFETDVVMEDDASYEIEEDVTEETTEE